MGRGDGKGILDISNSVAYINIFVGKFNFLTLNYPMLKLCFFLIVLKLGTDSGLQAQTTNKYPVLTKRVLVNSGRQS